MGIDPMTHKPKANASGCSQSNGLANLNHMAQWESARLQAEARLVRQPHVLFQLKNATAPPPRPPPPTILAPPCLNVLKQWQERWTKPETNISISPIMNSFFEGYSTAGNQLEFSTSTSIPTTVGNPSNNNYFLDELKAIADNAVELQDITNPSENPAFVGDSSRFPGLLNEFKDFPHGVDCRNAPDSDHGDELEGFLQENEANYLLDVTFPMISHLLY